MMTHRNVTTNIVHQDTLQRLANAVTALSKELETLRPPSADAPERTLEASLELSVAYAHADADVDAANRLLVEALRKRGEILRDILAATGPGPYRFGGRKVRIVERGTSFYLRTIA